MNELAQELNAEGREGFAKILAMDLNDMRDTSQAEHVVYLIDGYETLYRI